MHASKMTSMCRIVKTLLTCGAWDCGSTSLPPRRRPRGRTLSRLRGSSTLRCCDWRRSCLCWRLLTPTILQTPTRTLSLFKAFTVPCLRSTATRCTRIPFRRVGAVLILFCTSAGSCCTPCSSSDSRGGDDARRLSFFTQIASFRRASVCSTHLPGGFAVVIVLH